VIERGGHARIAVGDDLDAVVNAARRGDDVAFARLFNELQPRLLRYLEARSGAVVDDLAGDVWMAVAKSIVGFDGDWDDFRRWFFTIAHRRVADHHRTNHRRRFLVTASAFEDRSAATAIGADELALDRLSGQEAASLVATVLNANQAEVVLLRVIGDLDAEQVGAIMGRSPNWVRVTQHRALQLLAVRLGERATVTP
jgi:RNA polymerase sigma-70 factor, ECF subfamily